MQQACVDVHIYFMLLRKVVKLTSFTQKQYPVLGGINIKKGNWKKIKRSFH